MEERKKLPKRNIVLYVSIVVILISLTFKASYAFYTGVVINTTTPAATVVQSGSLELKFTNNTKYINVSDLGLMTAAEAAAATNNYSSFTVSNTGSVTGKYKLYLSNYTITDNLVDEDFKWKLTVGANEYSGTFYDLFNGKTATDHVISSTTDDVALVDNFITLASGADQNCQFRVWIQEEDHNQVSLTEGSFRGTIKLIAINE